MKVYIVGSLDNIKGQNGVKSLAKFLRSTGKFLVNDSWVSHGPDPDKFFKEYCKEDRKWDKPTAMSHPIPKSIFFVDVQFMLEADIVINLCPSGKSSAMESGIAFGSRKMLVLVLTDEDVHNYEKLEMMYCGFYKQIGISKFKQEGWKTIFDDYKKNVHLKWYDEVMNFKIDMSTIYL